MLSISDQHSSPLNHQQHFSPVQMGGAGFQRQRRAALGKRACPLLSMEKLCKLDGHATGGLLRKCPPPRPWQGSGSAQCRVVADSGPNSGTGFALGHRRGRRRSGGGADVGGSSSSSSTHQVPIGAMEEAWKPS